MADSRSSTNSGKKKKSIVKLKVVVEKLQRSLSLGRLKSNSSNEDSTCVPEDVKEGHFAVMAVYGEEEPKRFVVSLSYLTHPSFLKLLEQAAEEYGFDHEGALPIPCPPGELEKILDDQQWQTSSTSSTTTTAARVQWGSCKALVQSY